MASAAGRSRKLLSLSYSGGGHLLPYHLGVSKSLLTVYHNNNDETAKITSRPISLPKIKSVAGSSAGAIASTVFFCLPHRLEEYAERFIDNGGRANFHLSEMLREEDSMRVESDNRVRDGNRPSSLRIATTLCSDGSPFLFSFGEDDDAFPTSPQQQQQQAIFHSVSDTEKILECVKASCHIPLSFHPIDAVPNFWGGGGSLTYPDSEGIFIDGMYHVDGGISSPAPLTPYDTMENVNRVVISPISGGGSKGNNVDEYRISPHDSSMKLLPFEVKCRGGFNVRPSMQNVRSLVVSMGVAQKEELRNWYDRGVADGDIFIAKLMADVEAEFS